VLTYFPQVTRETVAALRYERFARMERARSRGKVTIVLMVLVVAGVILLKEVLA
jgi:hypothetical protein